MEGKVCLCMLFYSPFPVAVTVISAAVLSVISGWECRFLHKHVAEEEATKKCGEVSRETGA